MKLKMTQGLFVSVIWNKNLNESVMKETLLWENCFISPRTNVGCYLQQVVDPNWLLFTDMRIMEVVVNG